MDQLHKEPDEAHDGEADGGRDRNLLELFSVRLCEAFHQSDGVLAEVPHGLDVVCDLIHPEEVF